MHRFLSESQVEELHLAQPDQSQDPFEKVPVSQLPALEPDGDLAQLRLAISRQVERCNAQDPNFTWRISGKSVSRRAWCLETGAAFIAEIDRASSWSDFWQRIKTGFDWYRSKGRDDQGEVFFTGYFVPLMHGADRQSGQFHYPVYGRPADLVRVVVDGKYVWRRKRADGTFVPYYTRREIDWDGALAGRRLELSWVDDRIDAFFLHIQGSGILETKDNQGQIRSSFLNYDSQNGQAYNAIGRILRGEGVPEEYLTMQGLKRYFHERPAEIDRVFPMNPSYVFFREEASGPFGSGGTILVPGHSIATDNSIFPLGGLCLFKTQKAVVANGQITRWEDFARIAVNQDTGGAIQGPGRVDIFWGAGEYAELAAGAQQTFGDIFIAVRRP
jgi:membrane-bound lytic murein transglycosylase A